MTAPTCSHRHGADAGRRRSPTRSSADACTTARPRSTSTAGAGGVSAARRCCCSITVVSLFSRGSTSASTSKAAWPGRCRRDDFTVDEAEHVCSTAQRDQRRRRKIQERTSAAGDCRQIQVGDQPARGRQAGAARRSPSAAEVDADDGQRQLGQLHVGPRDHREGHPGARHLPGRSSRCSSPGGSSGEWRSRRSSPCCTTS